MTESIQQAVIQRNKHLAKVAFGNFIDNKNRRHLKYQKQIQAETFNNIDCKQKSFRQIKHYVITKLGLRDKYSQIWSNRVANMKEQVFMNIKNNGIHL